ncbi:MAG: hypothetical protein LUQ70_03510 [Methanobacteriaceae archaeon]|nr:hypothetical protein [Methanobacteriaceae archaeon]
MCETCDFCGRPARERCLICDRCFCPIHKGADSYCYQCFTGTGLFEI